MPLALHLRLPHVTKTLLRQSATQLTHATTVNTSTCVYVQPAFVQEEVIGQSQEPHFPHFNPLCFDNPLQAFKAKSTGQLAGSLAIFKACGIKRFVNNAESLLHASKQALGATLVDAVVKRTFFKQFAAGETIEEVQPVANALHDNGISFILNYAVEEDVNAGLPEGFMEATDSPEECARDVSTQRFLRDIRAADNSRGIPFIAAKVTALGPPNLLERMSSHLTQQGDALDRGAASSNLRNEMLSALTTEELQAFDRMLGRLHLLASQCHTKGNMRFMLDAEQSYLQPAIDALVIQLQQTYNREEPIVFNTYQCYLQDAPCRLANDMNRARREGWRWGAKTVRGAYMHAERARALQLGTSDPIWPSLEDTHASYNGCVAEVLTRVRTESPQLMVASHNQRSVELAVEGMHARRLPTSAGVYFGTLLGMADHIAFTLGASGYRAYKMLPYGECSKVIPYLVRRAQENSDVLGGCAKEVRMMQTELLRRCRPSNFWASRHVQHAEVHAARA